MGTQSNAVTKPALKSLASLNPVQAIERNLIGSLSEFDYQDASINATNIAGDKKVFLDVVLIPNQEAFENLKHE